MVEVRGIYIETLANYYAAIAELEKAGGIIILNLTEKWLLVFHDICCS